MNICTIHLYWLCFIQTRLRTDWRLRVPRLFLGLLGPWYWQVTGDSLIFVKNKITTSINNNVGKVRFVFKHLFWKILFAFLRQESCNVTFRSLRCFSLSGDWKVPVVNFVAFRLDCGIFEGQGLQLLPLQFLCYNVISSPSYLHSYYKTKPFSTLNTVYMGIAMEPSAIASLKLNIWRKMTLPVSGVLSHQ